MQSSKSRRKKKILALIIPPSFLSPPSCPPPGSHSHHHAGVQKLLRWVCSSPSASHAAHAEGEQEGEWIESSAPLLTPPPPPHHTYTHSLPLILKITMLLCVHRSLFAYNIQTDFKHDVPSSHGRKMY